MNRLLALVTCARAVLYVLYGVAVVWLAYQTAGELPVTAAPTSTGRLDANHQLVAGDLSTPATAALLNRYLREPVEPNKSVTPAMVSARPVLPVLPSGIEVVVNIEKSHVLAHGIWLDRLVHVQRTGGLW